MGPHYKTTNEEFKKAVEESQTYSDVMRKLNLVGGGDVRRSVQRRVAKLELDDSHLLQQKWRKGLPSKHKNREVPLDKLFVKGVKRDSHNLKLRLIREGLLERECSSCGLIQWMEQPIPLSLDHIDGDHLNNLMENLRVLCENCHALTPTWRGRNRKGKIHET